MSYELKPLEPDVHGTGRWSFEGKNLTPQDVESLARKGVLYPEDYMPDNRLKHPLFRLSFRARSRRPPMQSPSEFDAQFAEWGDEYDAVPDPKPDFFEWFGKAHPRILAKVLLREMLIGHQPGQALKAANTFLEFAKSKPKQSVEVSNVTPQPATNDELKDAFTEAFGISRDDVDRLVFAHKSGVKPV